MKKIMALTTGLSPRPANNNNPVDMPQKVPVIAARRFIRRMRGNTHAYLVQAENLAFYVVKTSMPAHHRRILINELVVSVYIRQLGLPTAEPAIITVSQELAEEYSSAGKHAENPMHLRPGPHFGSCYPGDPDTTAVYDFLPDPFLTRVHNVRSFLGMLALDKWISNADRRQCVFYRVPGSPVPPESVRAQPALFTALMIDHGSAFDGCNWRFPDSPSSGLYLARSVYRAVRRRDDFQPWLDRLLYFPEALLHAAVRQVPDLWFEEDRSDFDSVVERLLARRRRIPDLIDACRAADPSVFPNWITC